MLSTPFFKRSVRMLNSVCLSAQKQIFKMKLLRMKEIRSSAANRRSVIQIQNAGMFHSAATHGQLNLFVAHKTHNIQQIIYILFQRNVQLTAAHYLASLANEMMSTKYAENDSLRGDYSFLSVSK